MSGWAFVLAPLLLLAAYIEWCVWVSWRLAREAGEPFDHRAWLLGLLPFVAVVGLLGAPGVGTMPG